MSFDQQPRPRVSVEAVLGTTAAVLGIALVGLVVVLAVIA